MILLSSNTKYEYLKIYRAIQDFSIPFTTHTFFTFMSTAAVSLYSKSKLQKNNFSAKEMFENDT